MNCVFRIGLVVCLAFAAATGSLHAAAAPPAQTKNELLRLVPNDVAFCLVVQDLRAHLNNLEASPFARHWERSALSKAVAKSPEGKQLREVGETIKKQLGLGWREIVEDLVGDAVVFAYRPGPPAKPEEEQGMVLVRARDAQTLTAFVEKLNKLQLKTGELKKLEKREHRGIAYFCREEAKQNDYYFIQGAVLAFSAREDFLKSAIDLHQTAPRTGKPFIARQLQALGFNSALAAVFINPRAFDSAVVSKSTEANAKAVGRIWKAVQGIGLGLHLEKDVSFSLAIRAVPSDLPESVRGAFTELKKPTALWNSFPEDALFACAGKFDPAGLYQLVSGLLSPEQSKKAKTDLNRTVGAVLGKDVLKEILPAIGPDWGICWTAPPTDGKDWFPIGLFALRVSGGQDDPIDKALLAGVHSGALLIVLSHNTKELDKPLKIRTLGAEKDRVRFITGTGVFPPGLAPAYALRMGYLLLGTNPTTVQRFAANNSAQAVGEGNLLMRASFKSLRSYVASRREELAAALAAKNDTTKALASRKLGAFLNVLDLLDRMEVRQRAKAGRISWTLSLKPAQPLQ
jgi:hypothetical protein